MNRYIDIPKLQAIPTKPHITQITWITADNKTSFTWSLLMCFKDFTMDKQSVISKLNIGNRLQPIPLTNKYMKKSWSMVSAATPHKLQTYTTTQLRDHRHSSVGIRWWINLQQTKLLEEGVAWFQIFLYQEHTWPGGDINEKASSKVRLPSKEGRQIAWSSSEPLMTGTGSCKSKFNGTLYL